MRSQEISRVYVVLVGFSMWFQKRDVTTFWFVLDGAGLSTLR